MIFIFWQRQKSKKKFYQGFDHCFKVDFLVEGLDQVLKIKWKAHGQ